MDNNKNRQKDRPKSNAELRKMYSESGAEIGIENGIKKALIQTEKNLLRDQSYLTTNKIKFKALYIITLNYLFNRYKKDDSCLL